MDFGLTNAFVISVIIIMDFLEMIDSFEMLSYLVWTCFAKLKSVGNPVCGKSDLACGYI